MEVEEVAGNGYKGQEEENENGEEKYEEQDEVGVFLPQDGKSNLGSSSDNTEDPLLLNSAEDVTRGLGESTTGVIPGFIPVSQRTYLDMAIDAIVNISVATHKAILKYIMANYDVGSDKEICNSRLKVALINGCNRGTLKHDKAIGAEGSFTLG